MNEDWKIKAANTFQKKCYANTFFEMYYFFIEYILMSVFLTECWDELESLGFHPSPVCIYIYSENWNRSHRSYSGDAGIYSAGPDVFIYLSAILILQVQIKLTHWFRFFLERIEKEISLCHKLWFSNLCEFCYHNFTPSGCKDLGILKIGVGEKILFLCLVIILETVV